MRSAPADAEKRKRTHEALPFRPHPLRCYACPGFSGSNARASPDILRSARRSVDHALQTADSDAAALSHRADRPFQRKSRQRRMPTASFPVMPGVSSRTVPPVRHSLPYFRSSHPSDLTGISEICGAIPERRRQLPVEAVNTMLNRSDARQPTRVHSLHL